MRTGPVVSGLLLALALGGCALVDGRRDGPPTPAERGHDVALRRCAGCHAVEPRGVSRRPRAAPFGSREMQHTAGLAGRLAALTRQGHYGMPPIELTAQQIDDVVAYIESLGEGDDRSR